VAPGLYAVYSRPLDALDPVSAWGRHSWWQAGFRAGFD
jgi:hypothetical protein